MVGRGTRWDGGVVSIANTLGAVDTENFGKAKGLDCVCVSFVFECAVWMISVQFGRLCFGFDGCVCCYGRLCVDIKCARVL